MIRTAAAVVLVGLAGIAQGDPVVPVLSYQGILENGGEPFTGTADIEVRLWDSLAGGAAVSIPFTFVDRAVDEGRFFVSPNFGGNVYDGDQVFIEFKVDGVTLSPRQPLNPAPLASRVTGIQRNDSTGFVGIGRDQRVSSAEVFGIYSPTSGYGGMYVETDAGGQPFYGYSRAGNVDAFHYLDGSSGSWRLAVGFATPITATLGGNVGINNVLPTKPLDVAGESTFSDNVGIGVADPFWRLDVSEDNNGFAAVFENTLFGSTALGAFGPDGGIGVFGSGDGSGGIAVKGNGFDGALAAEFNGDAHLNGYVQVRSRANGVATPTNHTMLIENTDTGTSTDVLAVKTNSSDLTPGSAINFISFFNDANDNLGSIQGNSAGSIELAGAGNDYAEWLEQMSESEDIGPGCVVGVRGGKITLDTAGADQVMVVSTSPIVTGNRPFSDDDGIAGWQRVAFIGQAPVLTRGPVTAGQFLVPSGLGDGTAVAVSGSAITPAQLTQVLGVAWESSAGGVERTVKAAVGIDQADANSYVLRAQAERINGLEARLERLEKALR